MGKSAAGIIGGIKNLKVKAIKFQGWALSIVCALLSFCVAAIFSQPQKNTKQISPTIEKIIDNQSEPVDDNELKVMAGLTALEGTGITVELDDSTKTAKSGENPNLYVIHDDDVLRVINELRAAGAEAIAINGQRLIDTSEIRCAGPTLSVNNVRSAAPFVISAIGDKTALENSIKMRGGVEQTLKVWGIRVEVKTYDDIYIPPFKGTRKLTYAKPTVEKIIDVTK